VRTGRTHSNGKHLKNTQVCEIDVIPSFPQLVLGGKMSCSTTGISPKIQFFMSYPTGLVWQRLGMEVTLCDILFLRTVVDNTFNMLVPKKHLSTRLAIFAIKVYS
jgi:hypothetical protein